MGVRPWIAVAVAALGIGTAAAIDHDGRWAKNMGARTTAHRLATMAVMRTVCMRELGLAEDDHTLESCGCAARAYDRLVFGGRATSLTERLAGPPLASIEAVAPGAADHARTLRQWLSAREDYRFALAPALRDCRARDDAIPCVAALGRALAELADEHRGDNPAFTAVLDDLAAEAANW